MGRKRNNRLLNRTFTMNKKLARKLFNYHLGTGTDSHPDIYIIHLIDENGQAFNVIQVDYLLDGYRFTFSQGEEVFQLWEEEIDESQIFVFKQINWNKI